MGKKAGKKKDVVEESVEELEETEQEEAEETEETEPEAEEIKEPEEVEEIEEPEEVEEPEEPTDEEIIDAAADITDILGLEPPLWKEGMDAQTTAKRMRKAWKFIQADDVLKDETLKTLIAMGWEPPKPKKAPATGKPGKKPVREKKEKALKEPKEKKAPMSWKDPARLNSAMAVIIYFSVINPKKTIEEIQKEIEKRGFTGASLKSISAQGGYARRVMNCARDLNLLK